MKIEKRIKLYTDEEMDFARKQDEAFSNGFYEEKQTIKEERPILKLITLKNNRFGYTSDDGILFMDDNHQLNDTKW